MNKTKIIIVNIVAMTFVALIIIGTLSIWYAVDDSRYCRKHEESNLNINFEWNFFDGCMFELPDGTWINLSVYKDRNQYELEIEK